MGKGRNQRRVPDSAPLPMVTLKKKPPVLNDDQAKDAMPKFLLRIRGRAQRLVKSGRVTADIVRLADLTVPEINDALIGREIEYVFSIARTKRGRSSAYPYVGVIEKVRVVSATPAHTPTTHLEDKGKAKGKGKGKAKQRKAKAKAAAAQLPVRLPSVWVRWTLPHDTPCWVFLVSGLYGQGTKVDGWAIRPKEAEETSNDPMELSVEEAMHLHAIKAEMLCPKMQL